MSLVQKHKVKRTRLLCQCPNAFKDLNHASGGESIGESGEAEPDFKTSNVVLNSVRHSQ